MVRDDDGGCPIRSRRKFASADDAATWAEGWALGLAYGRECTRALAAAQYDRSTVAQQRAARLHAELQVPFCADARAFLETWKARGISVEVHDFLRIVTKHGWTDVDF